MPIRILFLFAATLLNAQTPSFEAASINRAAPLAEDVRRQRQARAMVSFSPGGLRMLNATLEDMILTAYSIRPHQVAGASLSQDRFDLVATAGARTSPDAIRTMLRTLLAERFKLQFHSETKEMTVNALVAGRNGSKLGDPKPEGSWFMGADGVKMEFRNFSMAKLVDFFEERADGAPYVDATGIEGFYDFSVPLDASSDNPGEAKRAMVESMRDGTFARSVAKEIGLKIESRKGPVEILVIDHAERAPTGN